MATDTLAVANRRRIGDWLRDSQGNPLISQADRYTARGKAILNFPLSDKLSDEDRTAILAEVADALPKHTIESYVSRHPMAPAHNQNPPKSYPEYDAASPVKRILGQAAAGQESMFPSVNRKPYSGLLPSVGDRIPPPKTMPEKIARVAGAIPTLVLETAILRRVPFLAPQAGAALLSGGNIARAAATGAIIMGSAPSPDASSRAISAGLGAATFPLAETIPGVVGQAAARRMAPEVQQATQAAVRASQAAERASGLAAQAEAAGAPLTEADKALLDQIQNATGARAGATATELAGAEARQATLASRAATATSAVTTPIIFGPITGYTQQALLHATGHNVEMPKASDLLGPESLKNIAALGVTGVMGLGGMREVRPAEPTFEPAGGPREAPPGEAAGPRALPGPRTPPPREGNITEMMAPRVPAAEQAQGVVRSVRARFDGRPANKYAGGQLPRDLFDREFNKALVATATERGVGPEALTVDDHRAAAAKAAALVNGYETIRATMEPPKIPLSDPDRMRKLNFAEAATKRANELIAGKPLTMALDVPGQKEPVVGPVTILRVEVWPWLREDSVRVFLRDDTSGGTAALAFDNVGELAKRLRFPAAPPPSAEPVARLQTSRMVPRTGPSPVGEGLAEAALSGRVAPPAPKPLPRSASSGLDPEALWRGGKLAIDELMQPELAHTAWSTYRLGNEPPRRVTELLHEMQVLGIRVKESKVREMALRNRDPKLFAQALQRRLLNGLEGRVREVARQPVQRAPREGAAPTAPAAPTPTAGSPPQSPAAQATAPVEAPPVPKPAAPPPAPPKPPARPATAGEVTHYTRTSGERVPIKTMASPHLRNAEAKAPAGPEKSALRAEVERRGLTPKGGPDETPPPTPAPAPTKPTAPKPSGGAGEQRPAAVRPAPAHRPAPAGGRAGEVGRGAPAPAAEAKAVMASAEGATAAPRVTANGTRIISGTIMPEPAPRNAYTPEKVASTEAGLEGRYKKAGVPEDRRIKLMEHQVHNVGMAMQAFDSGNAIAIADSTGTGKTVTGIILALEAEQRFGDAANVLVAPNQGIIEQWRREAAMFGLEIEPIRTSSSAAPGKGKLVAVTYATLMKRKGDVGFQPHLVIFDEAHKGIGGYNPGAKPDDQPQSAAAMNLARAARHRAYLTATPMSTPLDFAYLGEFMPAAYPSFNAMLTELGIRFDFSEGRWYGLNKDKLLELHEKLVRAGVYTRTELIPEDIKNRWGDPVRMYVSPVMVGTSAETASKYNRAADVIDAYKQELRMRRQSAGARVVSAQRTAILRAIVEEGRVADALAIGDQKLAAGFSLAYFVERLEGGDFENKESESRYVAELWGRLARAGIRHESPVDLLRKHYLSRGVRVSEITGKTPAGSVSRQAGVDAYQSGESPVAVVTFAAGGTGLSLHDLIGNHPRFGILIQTPYDANTGIQTLGRLFRLGSQSNAQFVVLSTATPTDKKYTGRFLNRVKAAGYIVRGDESQVGTHTDVVFEYEKDMPDRISASTGMSPEQVTERTNAFEFDKATADARVAERARRAQVAEIPGEPQKPMEQAALEMIPAAPATAPKPVKEPKLEHSLTANERERGITAVDKAKAERAASAAMKGSKTWGEAMDKLAAQGLLSHEPEAYDETKQVPGHHTMLTQRVLEQSHPYPAVEEGPDELTEAERRDAEKWVGKRVRYKGEGGEPVREWVGDVTKVLRWKDANDEIMLEVKTEHGHTDIELADIIREAEPGEEIGYYGTEEEQGFDELELVIDQANNLPGNASLIPAGTEAQFEAKLEADGWKSTAIGKGQFWVKGDRKLFLRSQGPENSIIVQWSVEKEAEPPPKAPARKGKKLEQQALAVGTPVMATAPLPGSPEEAQRGVMQLSQEAQTFDQAFEQLIRGGANDADAAFEAALVSGQPEPDGFDAAAAARSIRRRILEEQGQQDLFGGALLLGNEGRVGSAGAPAGALSDIAERPDLISSEAVERGVGDKTLEAANIRTDQRFQNRDTGADLVNHENVQKLLERNGGFSMDKLKLHPPIVWVDTLGELGIAGDHYVIDGHHRVFIASHNWAKDPSTGKWVITGPSEREIPVKVIGGSLAHAEEQAEVANQAGIANTLSERAKIAHNAGDAEKAALRLGIKEPEAQRLINFYKVDADLRAAYFPPGNEDEFVSWKLGAALGAHVASLLGQKVFTKNVQESFLRRVVADGLNLGEFTSALNDWVKQIATHVPEELLLTSPHAAQVMPSEWGAATGKLVYDVDASMAQARKTLAGIIAQYKPAGITKLKDGASATAMSSFLKEHAAELPKHAVATMQDIQRKLATLAEARKEVAARRDSLLKKIMAGQSVAEDIAQIKAYLTEKLGTVMRRAVAATDELAKGGPMGAGFGALDPIGGWFWRRVLEGRKAAQDWFIRRQGRRAKTVYVKVEGTGETVAKYEIKAPDIASEEPIYRIGATSNMMGAMMTLPPGLREEAIVSQAARDYLSHMAYEMFIEAVGPHLMVEAPRLDPRAAALTDALENKDTPAANALKRKYADELKAIRGVFDSLRAMAVQVAKAEGIKPPGFIEHYFPHLRGQPAASPIDELARFFYGGRELDAQELQDVRNRFFEHREGDQNYQRDPWIGIEAYIRAWARWMSQVPYLARAKQVLSSEWAKGDPQRAEAVRNIVREMAFPQDDIATQMMNDHTRSLFYVKSSGGVVQISLAEAASYLKKKPSDILGTGIEHHHGDLAHTSAYDRFVYVRKGSNASFTQPKAWVKLGTTEHGTIWGGTDGHAFSSNMPELVPVLERALRYATKLRISQMKNPRPESIIAEVLRARERVSRYQNKPATAGMAWFSRRVLKALIGYSTSSIFQNSTQLLTHVMPEYGFRAALEGASRFGRATKGAVMRAAADYFEHLHMIDAQTAAAWRAGAKYYAEELYPEAVGTRHGQSEAQHELARRVEEGEHEIDARLHQVLFSSLGAYGVVETIVRGMSAMMASAAAMRLGHTQESVEKMIEADGASRRKATLDIMRSVRDPKSVAWFMANHEYFTNFYYNLLGQNIGMAKPWFRYIIGQLSTFPASTVVLRELRDLLGVGRVAVAGVRSIFGKPGEPPRMKGSTEAHGVYEAPRLGAREPYGGSKSRFGSFFQKGGASWFARWSAKSFLRTQLVAGALLMLSDLLKMNLLGLYTPFATVAILALLRHFFPDNAFLQRSMKRAESGLVYRFVGPYLGITGPIPTMWARYTEGKSVGEILWNSTFGFLGGLMRMLVLGPLHRTTRGALETWPEIFDTDKLRWMYDAMGQRSALYGLDLGQKLQNSLGILDPDVAVAARKPIHDRSTSLLPAALPAAP